MTRRSRRRVSSTTVALVVAATLAVGTHLWFETRLVAENNTVDVIVASDGAGSIAGQDVRLVSAAADESGLEHPAGTRTVTVRFAIDPGAQASSCRPITLSERDGARRTWEEQTATATDGASIERTTCGADTVAYTVHAVFILPADAAGPFAVEFRDGASRVLRFDLDV